MSETAETGWLIEHEDEPKWLTLRPPEAMTEVVWTKDSNEALRFARRQDAEDYVMVYFGGEGPITITEHAWWDGKQAEYPKRAFKAFMDRVYKRHPDLDPKRRADPNFQFGRGRP